MTRRRQAAACCLLIVLLSGVVGPSEATDLQTTISNLYGPSGIFLQTNFRPFGDAPSQFKATSLQGLDDLNNQLTSAIGVPSFSSSVTGFTFDFDRGIPLRTTESLGPLLTERATTLGARKLDLSLTYTRVDFTKLQGQALDNLELVFLRNDTNEPCDPSEPLCTAARRDVIRTTLNVDLSEDIVALIATYGVTPHWDVGVVVPVIHIRLTATAHAAIFDQFGNPGGTIDGNVPIHFFGPNSTRPDASGGGDATGLGDILLRTKYNFLRDYNDVVPDLAFLVEVKLPTGDEGDLLGTGGTNITGLLVGSKTYGQWLTPHFNLGYEIDTKDTRQSAIRYAIGLDARLTPELTVAAAVIGRVKPDGGETGDHITDLSLGVKWNPAKSLILRANVQIPLDKNSGLRADFIPTVGVEYLF
jgi:hypothetical protein